MKLAIFGITLLLASTGSFAITSLSSIPNTIFSGIYKNIALPIGRFLSPNSFAANLTNSLEKSVLCTPVSSIEAKLLLSKMRIYFFYGSTVEERVVVRLSKAATLLDDEHWKKDRPVVLFTPGWIQSPTSKTSAEPMVEAFGENGQFNFLLLDWYDISSQWYGVAVTMVPRVGEKAAEALQTLLDAGAVLDSLVGHSLGAHVSGYIGRNLNKRPRLIASLDPAGPFFCPTMLKCQDGIQPSLDAEYVMHVHTDWNGMGCNEYLGPVDFMPNGGRKLQPGCSSLNTDDVSVSCSHLRAVRLYADAIRNPSEALLLGRLCPSEELFTSKTCSNNPTLKFTDVATTNGVYYLTTQGSSPFGLGERGV